MPGRIQFHTSSDGSESLTERMRIDSSGRVGVGTTSPETLLHVEGSSDTKATIETTANSNAGLRLRSSNCNMLIQAGQAVADNLRIYNEGTSSELVRFMANGNVVIKTNDVALSGSGTLRVNSGSTSGALNLDGGSTNHGGEINLTGGSNGGRIQFRTGQGSGQQNEKMRLDENGRLGIGTISPAVKFVVSNGGAEGLEVSHSSGNVELNAYNRSTSARSPVGIVGQTFTVTTGNPNLNTGLFQNSSGNVGIGTTSPTDKLHVVGTALISSNTYVNGNLYY